MCNINCILFGARYLTKEEIEGKRVIEVGSYDVNGGLRSYVESLKPSEYIGVDIKEGPGVDVVCRAEDLTKRFGDESFDVVISTELLEHIKDWRKVISNLKNISKKGGIILITTRSIGAPYHAYPYDFWRYEPEDMMKIFADCEIIALEKDTYSPGVFIKLKKPQKFLEKNPTDYELYSIVIGRRVKEITDKDLKSFYFARLVFKHKLKNLILKVLKVIFSQI